MISTILLHNSNIRCKITRKPTNSVGEKQMYKNIEKQVKLELKDLVEYQEGQVVSKTLVQNNTVSMTIFLLIKGKKFLHMLPAEMQW